MNRILSVSTAAFCVLMSFKGSAQAVNDQKNVTVANSANEATKLGLAGSTTSIASFSSKEDTRGSRYLATDWMKGEVTDTAGMKYDNQAYYFNYDKITHHLYLTTDKKEVIELDERQISSFSLSSYSNGPMDFVRVPAIAPEGYVQRLTDGRNGYQLYKLTKTKFQKANYRSSGLVESGNNYDEFVDDYSYYIGEPGSTEFKKLELSKKTLKKAFSGNEKADRFFTDHQADAANEHFLRELVAALGS